MRCLSLVLLALALAGCGRPPVPDLTTARAVRIVDSWSGLSPLAPIESRYDLALDGGAGTGTARFSVAAGERTSEAEVAVPAEVVQSFLETLAGSPLREAAYEPKIDRTDDYPWVQIEIDLDSETVTFFSTSQGTLHVPWGVTFGGKTYVIDADTPARALGLLAPYLKGELLDALMDRPS